LSAFENNFFTLIWIRTRYHCITCTGWHFAELNKNYIAKRLLIKIPDQRAPFSGLMDGKNIFQFYSVICCKLTKYIQWNTCKIYVTRLSFTCIFRQLNDLNPSRSTVSGIIRLTHVQEIFITKLMKMNHG
jgi:hypothetical protein